MNKFLPGKVTFPFTIKLESKFAISLSTNDNLSFSLWTGILTDIHGELEKKIIVSGRTYEEAFKKVNSWTTIFTKNVRVFKEIDFALP